MPNKREVYWKALNSTWLLVEGSRYKGRQASAI